jgi:2-polyprenyl-6-hydroxyphenyl methylase/3-demethylubiquinone-9 3-methyltransferase
MSEASERSRAVWSAGNWDEVSKLMPPAGQVVLDHAGVGSGMDVLDVGCGSGGTVAIPAALRGANVTGADVAPEHFDAARRRAQEAGVEVEWVAADAAEMPFEDESFDRVLSTFGHAFAPDQEGTAREIVRLCRPGGVIACAMWTPEGFNGRMFQVTGKHMPPPPPGFTPPVAWGTEERWRELVGSQGVELEFHREILDMEHEKPAEEFFDEFAGNFGPLVMASRALGDDGFAALRADLMALYEEGNEASNGGTRIPAEYLVAVGRKPA